MKIKAKAIIFLTAIILITGLIVSIANQIISKKIIKEQIRLNLESTAQSRAHNIETFLNNHIELTKMISTGNVFRDIVDERVDFIKTNVQIKRRILSFINSHPEIDRIRILDKNGIVVADSYNDTVKDLSEEAVYKNGKDSSYIGVINRSLNSGNIDICISNPILVRNIFSGVLIINFDIENILFEITENRIGLGETGEIYLINRDGYMVTPSRFLNNVILKQKAVTPESRECWGLSGDKEKKERDEVDIYQSYWGEQVIGTHYRVKGTDCCLLAEISLEQALAPIRGLTIISISILIILVVLIISISLIIVTSITKPIRKLHIGVNEILRGNLDYKVATQSKDEIGQLSRAFDDMGTKLIKSKNELENHAVKLEKDVDERTVELEKQFQKSEGQRIATLSVLSDLNETTKNLKLEIAERKRSEQIQQVIHNISNAVITTDDLEEFIKVVKDRLNTIIDTTNFYIALYEEKTDSFQLLFHKDKKDEFKSFPAGKTLTAYVIKTKKPLLATRKVKNRLVKSGEIELLGADSKIWLGIPLLVKGEVTGAFAVQSYKDENAYDESDMKMLQTISHQISISLERKKAEEDLKTALAKAHESERLKSAFLSNMSHEIRTPLTGIIGFIDLLYDPNYSMSQKQGFSKIINKSSRRLINTITDLIDISKIEAGQMEVSNAETSINGLLDDLHAFFAPKANSKGLTLTSLPTLPLDKATVFIDDTKLHGILSNLINNAIKYTEKGRITFGYVREGNFIKFFVKDTGIGVPAHRQHAIFNRFEQADIEDVMVYEGSGLGLAIAKAYVEMLGGKIWVTSEEGHGSKFMFTVPYSKKTAKKIEPGQKPKEKFQTEIVTSDLVALIVEDDEVSLFYFETILEGIFREIIYAKTGNEAIEICRGNTDIDIVLMDIKMPVMNGYDAAREIRKFNKDLVIIAQTAYAQVGDREKALEAGCNDYITKPIKKEILIGKIMGLINN
ncbi:MAG: hypothetical protein B6I19_07485 [Bacteroidetes bacterium 4572_114]|nr:MAG: hypothetical protein B6I19_07485 [Bacteroidetes bacterium 4572_114]